MNDTTNSHPYVEGDLVTDGVTGPRLQVTKVEGDDVLLSYGGAYYGRRNAFDVYPA